MTRQLRPIVIASALLLVASPALAQKKALKGVPTTGPVYGPVYGSGTADRDDDRDDDDRDDDDRDDDRDHDRDDDDRWDDDHGESGRHGRGHAYGQYRNREEKEYHKQLDKDRRRARKGDMCRDADRDAICDVAQRDRSRCTYDTRADRCVDVHSPTRYPSTLPEMAGAVIAARGQRSAEAARWLGGRAASVRTVRARDGRLAQASWFDRSGTLVQRWFDRDLDGRADMVQLYRNGQLLRTVSR